MTHSSPREDEWKMSSNWPPLDLACFFNAQQRQTLRGPARGAASRSLLLLFLSASRTEKQFITLPDSLSETDTIKNNIKWIMFSSDWYRYNCRPDCCQRGGGVTNKSAGVHTRTHVLRRRGSHTDAAISCLCAWVICPPLPAPDGLRVLSLVGELMMWATCFGRKNNNKRVFNLQRRKRREAPALRRMGLTDINYSAHSGAISCDRPNPFKEIIKHPHRAGRPAEQTAVTGEAVQGRTGEGDTARVCEGSCWWVSRRWRRGVGETMRTVWLSLTERSSGQPDEKQKADLSGAIKQGGGKWELLLASHEWRQPSSCQKLKFCETWVYLKRGNNFVCLSLASVVVVLWGLVSTRHCKPYSKIHTVSIHPSIAAQD